MYDKLAARYRAQRDDELDLAERARIALHAARWEDLNPGTPFLQMALACHLAGHDGFAPDFGIDVFAVNHGQEPYVVVAADGSQVMPDSRYRYPVAAIQVATVQIYHDESYLRPVYHNYEWTPDDPQIIEILMSGERLSWMTDAIGALRDQKELDALVLAANDLPIYPTVDAVAMPDGPLHIYNERNVPERAHGYKDIRAMNVYLAGVVDRGNARYVSGALADAYGIDDFARVRDVDLFGNLLPGERSAFFGIKSQSNKALKRAAGLDVGLFYLNVGEQVVRVETPTDLSFIQVNALARIVMSECRGTGYPYVLIKAHEAAVVSAGMRQRIEMMHKATLTHYALAEDLLSYKEQLKSL